MQIDATKTVPHWRPGLLVLLLSAVSCGTTPEEHDSKPRPSRDVITQEQMLEHRFATAFEAVQSLRAGWLIPRGQTSLYGETIIWVYQDNNKLGGVETLRGVATNSVAFIRWFDPLAATARWGIDHTQGVIFISTFTASDPAGKGNP